MHQSADPHAARHSQVRVRGAREHNLRGVDVDIPRDALTVFTGVSGSGKSSLAFGTIYAEAQRRYFESVAPYARRLIHQIGAPKVDSITGLPPAVSLEQRRSSPGSRSSVGTVTLLSNSLRMLYSRAGTYPPGAGRLDSDAFSPNTAAGACPSCHGLGRIHRTSEELLVPDPELSIRQGAIAAWPGAWQGKNLRDVLEALGHDVDRPWRELPAKEREWILFTEEQPVVTVHPVRDADRIQRPYQGTYMSAHRYVMRTFADSKSATLRARAEGFLTDSPCPVCAGRRLRPEALAVTFAGHGIADLAGMALTELDRVLADAVTGATTTAAADADADAAATAASGEAARVLAEDLRSRIGPVVELGLGYLSLDRAAPTLSAGELQRLRLATQLRSGLFGVVYVLDEPSAGLHPADTEALLGVLDRLKEAGNTVFVVEHDMAVVRHADWLVDVGPLAGEHGGRVLYSGPPEALAGVEESATGTYLFGAPEPARSRPVRAATGSVRVSGAGLHNLRDVEAEFPLGVFTAVTGVSGSGKSTLVGQVLAREVTERMAEPDFPVRRLVEVDQKPIGRTPRSNLATYTGLFDVVRRLFTAAPQARARGWKAGRFSFNVPGGRCETCQGEGFVSVELLFLPSTYSPCPQCRGARYNAETLEVRYAGLNIAEVLALTVESAAGFFAQVPAAARSLRALQEIGLGYLRLGQPATELSGGEAQRIKLATELQRMRRDHTLYVLDEPTTGLHPADVRVLVRQLQGLVEAGHSVVVVEHDMAVVADADWVVDLGPGGGTEGGRIVAAGTPAEVAAAGTGRTAVYLARALAV
ncbi:ABC transporter [Streptomyces sp. CB00455]|uniref:excinuclease ABC subunit UvrA n=1 Tax=Streptomyces sp. CB00455 TaxID=1703927 RepID=UPI00093BF5C4|nr:excinuclease ABC subunit UvrA [Streptomyces sp. CB00455]OKK22312.1 ABC transporter [Streptomyces sp. CB00455]